MKSSLGTQKEKESSDKPRVDLFVPVALMGSGAHTRLAHAFATQLPVNPTQVVQNAVTTYEQIIHTEMDGVSQTVMLQISCVSGVESYQSILAQQEVLILCVDPQKENILEVAQVTAQALAGANDILQNGSKYLCAVYDSQGIPEPAAEKERVQATIGKVDTSHFDTGIVLDINEPDTLSAFLKSLAKARLRMLSSSLTSLSVQQASRSFVNIILMGDQAVGKSRLRRALVGETKHEAVAVYGPPTKQAVSTFEKYQIYEPTVGMNWVRTKVSIEQRQVQLTIWDLSGNRKYSTMWPLYFRNKHILLFCCDPTRVDAIERVREWVNRIQSDPENYPPAFTLMKYVVVLQNTESSNNVAQLMAFRDQVANELNIPCLSLAFDELDTKVAEAFLQDMVRNAWASPDFMQPISPFVQTPVVQVTPHEWRKWDDTLDALLEGCSDSEEEDDKEIAGDIAVVAAVEENVALPAVPVPSQSFSIHFGKKIVTGIVTAGESLTDLVGRLSRLVYRP